MRAVASNNIEMARLLLLREANIEAADEVTPLTSFMEFGIITYTLSNAFLP